MTTTKLKSDFSGFYDIQNIKWPSIKKWVFVTNQLKNNLPSELIAALKELKENYKPKYRIEIWTMDDIINKFNLFPVKKLDEVKNKLKEC